MIFSFGIEHEVAFLTHEGVFADFSATSFSKFDQIIERLPTYPDDYLQLHIGDAGIRKKRWYIEGFERFTSSGKSGDCLAKGIEIRTTIHPSIQSTIDELSHSFSLLCNIALEAGFSPVLTSFNPYKVAFKPDPPLNKYELQQLQDIKLDEETATIHMVTYGPDLNFSIANLSIEKTIDIGKKLIYYSPCIVPFSYSSPFYDGRLWQGLSVRTFIRTGQRPTALVFVRDRDQLIHNTLLLTKIARLPAEIGRIEFKAFDSCDDFSIYAALLALLKGLAMDESLPGRAATPDIELHQISAVAGFEDEDIFVNATAVLQAAELALRDDPDINLLTPLKLMLAERKTTSHTLIESFNRSGSIEKALKGTYQRSISQGSSGQQARTGASSDF